MDIIYEDNQKMIVFKPAGKLTQGNRSFDVDLVSEVMTYRRRKKEDAYAAVINRLDRPVSGMVLFAKNRQEAARLSKLLQNKTFDKQYEAIICGKPDADQGTFVDYLVSDAQTNKSLILSEAEAQRNQEAKRAELNYQILGEYTDEQGNSYSHVKIELITGRHHQIRAQFSSHGLPLLGDVKYGGRDAADLKLTTQDGTVITRMLKRNEIALCSVALTIDQKEFQCRPLWLPKDKDK